MNKVNLFQDILSWDDDLKDRLLDALLAERGYEKQWANRSGPYNETPVLNAYHDAAHEQQARIREAHNNKYKAVEIYVPRQQGEGDEPERH